MLSTSALLLLMVSIYQLSRGLPIHQFFKFYRA